MALIKLSSLVSAASGTIGGTVFSRNKGGAYVRTWAKPTNPNTAAQQVQRGKLGALATAWRSLSNISRQAWVDSATSSFRTVVNKLGETKNLTGFQLFLKQNLLRQVADNTLLVDPPLPLTYPSFQVSSATFSKTTGAVIEVTYDGGNDPLGDDSERLVIECSLPFAPGQKPKRNRILLAVANDSTEVVIAGQVATVSLTAAQVEDIIGAAAVGSLVNFKVRALNIDDPWDYLGQSVQEGQSTTQG